MRAEYGELMRSQSNSSKRNARVSILDSEERHTIGNHLAAIKGLVQLLGSMQHDEKSTHLAERLNIRINELIEFWTKVSSPTRNDHQSDSQNHEPNE